MRIAIIWDWENATEQTITWKDGLCAAIKSLCTRHDVKFYTIGRRQIIPHEYFPIHVVPSSDLVEDVKEFSPDTILHWADCTRPHAEPLGKLGIPMALCFAGGDTMAENWYRFAHVFVENDEYKQKFDEQEVACTVAFGTNTGLYTPIENAQRNIDVYFPATFADWKRHDLFYKSVAGLRAMCAGYMYEERERYCWEEPMKRGVTVVPHVSAATNRFLMAQSKVILVTSKNIGGSQRTVLEALAMNTPVIVMSDSIKCSEYLKGIGREDWIVDPEPAKIREKIEQVMAQEPVDTRSALFGHWDEETYASRIEEGLKSIL
jgi:hypothetical protein